MIKWLLAILTAPIVFFPKNSASTHPRPKWEYKTLNTVLTSWAAGMVGLQNTLNALGREGWEAVAAYGGVASYVILKRRTDLIPLSETGNVL